MDEFQLAAISGFWRGRYDALNGRINQEVMCKNRNFCTAREFGYMQGVDLVKKEASYPCLKSIESIPKSG